MPDLKLPTGPTIIYKIRRSDGLFSMGGSTPHFNKTGKVWKQKGHLTSHINQLWNNGLGYRAGGPRKHVYEDCEIVPYEIIETPVGDGQTILDYIAERKAAKQEEERQRQIRREEQAKQSRKKEYEKLKLEFE